MLSDGDDMKGVTKWGGGREGGGGNFAVTGTSLSVNACQVQSQLLYSTLKRHVCTIAVHNEHTKSNSVFTRRVPTQGRCYVWLCLTEFSGLLLSCFTLSRSTIFMDALLRKLKDFQPIVHGNSYLGVMGHETWEHGVGYRVSAPVLTVDPV